MKKIITDDMILGYRDYTIDRKTKKDFPTIESVVEWLSGVTEHDTEVTKEFYDFAEQEYGIGNIINKMKEMYPFFPYCDGGEQDLIDTIKSLFEYRNNEMHASDFTE
jgi:hypothetical protein